MSNFNTPTDKGNNVFIDNVNINGTVGIETPVLNDAYFTVYPNPSEGKATIEFELMNTSNITLRVMDILGNEIATLNNEALNKGIHTFQLSDSDKKLSAGIYLISLQAGTRHYYKKITVY